MRIRTLLAATIVSLSVLITLAPAAHSAPAEEVITTATPATVGCQFDFEIRFIRVSCIHAAPGTQYRAYVECSDGSIRHGIWRNQTQSYWDNYSMAACPFGTSWTYNSVLFR